MVYLCGRPLPNRGRCTLGRETAIQPMTWSADGWLRTTTAKAFRPWRWRRRGADAAATSPPAPFARSSTTETLPIAFQWLRSPYARRVVQPPRAEATCVFYGRETIGSLFKQALVARRQQSHCYSASTIVEVEPEHFQQMAGLVCYYNSSKFHYFYVSRDEEIGKHLRVMSALPDQVTSDAFTPPIAIAGGAPIELRVEVDYERLRSRIARTEACGSGCRSSSTRASSRMRPAPGLPNFTGAFVGMACQDLAGNGDAGGLRLVRAPRAGVRQRRVPPGNVMKHRLSRSPSSCSFRQRLRWTEIHACTIHPRSCSTTGSSTATARETVCPSPCPMTDGRGGAPAR